MLRMSAFRHAVSCEEPTCDFPPLQATRLPATSPLELVSQAIPNGKGDDLWEPLYADRQPGGVPLVIQPRGVYLKAPVRDSSPLQVAGSSAAETINIISNHYYKGEK